MEDKEIESAVDSEKSVNGSNIKDYGFVYSAERPVPPPEASWSSREIGDKINLYSENILKEENTTESVDRESIADLSNTKKQWEVIFTANSKTPEDTSVKKKGTPKWEVRLPYKEKHVSISTNQNSETLGSGNTSDKEEEESGMFKKPSDSEGAIEREIRLAHEREEMLSREKEERQKQKGHGQSNHITSYEAESESFHPAYNELAEADRGTDMWGIDHGGCNGNCEVIDGNNVDPNESIIEREIRLQREKEEEISKMRKKSTNAHQQHSSPLPKQLNHTEDADTNHNQRKTITYEDAIANSSSEGESLIARELRELREREEELKRVHISLRGVNISDEPDGSTHTTPMSQNGSMSPAHSPRSPQGISQRDVSPNAPQHRRNSRDLNSGHSIGRSTADSTPSRREIRVRPIADADDDDIDNEKPNYFEKQETPIERELRLVRERENELRRLKGLPEIDLKDDDPFDSYGSAREPSHNAAQPIQLSLGQPNESMKKFASSRLQQELQQQKKIEHELRSQGKIITESNDRIELHKYMEVAGVDKVDGTEKRNFITKKTSVSAVEPELSPVSNEKASHSGQISRKNSTAAGGNMFSYKEFKQTAESKIEKELREMREREEELRMRRISCNNEPPQ